MRNCPVILVPSRAQRFEQVWKSCTTPNSCQLQPQVWFRVLSYGSSSFGRVEPPRMHVKFHRRSGFLWFEQVRKCWTTLNVCQLPPQVWFPVLSNGSTSFGRVEPCQVPPQAGFPVVRTGSEIWITRNSWESILRSMFPLELRGSTRFGRVEPPRTHVKLHWRHGFTCWTMVRTGSEELNRPELMSSSTAGLVSCVELWFEQVRKS